MLLGKSSRNDLEKKPFNAWFDSNYQNYKLDSESVEQLRKKMINLNFIIFMGTWCGDSRREVPRMFKLLDSCHINKNRIQLIMLDSRDSVYKQSPGHEERGLHIHRVPDLLVYSEEKELGRIVESPVQSLEKDLLSIVNGEHYTPNYKIVPILEQLFQVESLAEIRKKLLQTADSIKSLKTHFAELNSYAHVLLAQGALDKAEIVYTLNSYLYENNYNSYYNLGEYYFKTGNKEMAEENYRKVLNMQPGHQEARQRIEQLKK